MTSITARFQTAKFKINLKLKDLHSYKAFIPVKGVYDVDVADIDDDIQLFWFPPSQQNLDCMS